MADAVDTTSRLLGLLGCLQHGERLTAGVLADRLGVTDRTVRRDVDRLRQLGYVIEGEPGSAGGYRMGSGGSALPPLLLDEDEATALAIRARAGGGDTGDAAERAIRKLERSLPARIGRRVGAVVDATERLRPAAEPVDPAILRAVVAACKDGRELAVEYTTAAGERAERRVAPHRVVSAGQRWYLVAHDRRRQGWRTFRLDRMSSVRETGHPAVLVDPPDAAAFVAEAITTAPYRHRARVRIAAPLDELVELVPATVGVLEPIDDHTTDLVTGANDLDLLALHLGALGPEFAVVEPDELREHLQGLAERLGRAASSVP